MKRWPPFNQPDGTPWTNGNPAIGLRGSIIDQRAIDHAQAEITNAIIQLGLSPDKDDLQQLGKAIKSYVAALTGEGGDEIFATVPALRATLPIFPEVTTASGRLTITSPSSGTVFVSPEGSIVHRGVVAVAMSDIAEIDRTFSMLASKVAHLRWSPSGGLQRLYLDDGAYNPGGLPETDPSFDSSFDSALLCRAITDAAANVTLSTLANKARLESEQAVTGAGSAASEVGSFSNTFSLDWARTPIAFLRGDVSTSNAAAVVNGYANRIVSAVTRYAVAATISTDYQGAASGIGGTLVLQAVR